MSPVPSTIAAVLVALCAFVTGFAPTPATSETPKPAIEACPNAQTILLHCEAYRLDDAALIAKVEAATDASGRNHEDVHALVAAADSGATRLSRIHGPAQINTSLSYSNSKQVPVFQVNQGQFSTQQSFSGYQQASTRLDFNCGTTEGGYSAKFTLRVESFIEQEKKAPEVVPPPRSEVSLSGSISAPSGVTRMYQVDGGNSGGMLLVFVTMTAL